MRMVIVILSTKIAACVFSLLPDWLLARLTVFRVGTPLCVAHR